jgi:hypothetical protein
MLLLTTKPRGTPTVLSLALSWFRRPFQKPAHLDRRPTFDDGLAPPCKCILKISGFQHPKTAYVLIGHNTLPMNKQGFRLRRMLVERTAGPSASLRSGRDDNSFFDTYIPIINLRDRRFHEGDFHHLQSLGATACRV